LVLLLGLTLLRCSLVLLLWCSLVLLWSCLALLLLRDSPIGFLQRRWGLHVAVCRERPGYDQTAWPPMVDTRKLCAVGGGGMLILHLCPHRRSVLLMHRCQFRGTRVHLEAT
jgi:hypothetical protein